MRTIITLLWVLLLLGCASTKLQPLSEPKEKELRITSNSTTLEYGTPTYQAWKCHIHGEQIHVFIIEGKSYCQQCVLRKVIK